MTTLRLLPRERDLLQQAAALIDLRVASFIRATALRAAREVIADPAAAKALADHTLTGV